MSLDKHEFYTQPVTDEDLTFDGVGSTSEEPKPVDSPYEEAIAYFASEITDEDTDKPSRGRNKSMIAGGVAAFALVTASALFMFGNKDSDNETAIENSEPVATASLEEYKAEPEVTTPNVAVEETPLTTTPIEVEKEPVASVAENPQPQAVDEEGTEIDPAPTLPLAEVREPQTDQEPSSTPFGEVQDVLNIENTLNGMGEVEFDMTDMMIDLPENFTDADLENFEKMLETMSNYITYGYNNGNFAIVSALVGVRPLIDHSPVVQEVNDIQNLVDKDYRYGWKLVPSAQDRAGWWVEHDGRIFSYLELFTNESGNLDEDAWVSQGVSAVAFDKTTNYRTSNGQALPVTFWQIADHPLK